MQKKMGVNPPNCHAPCESLRGGEAPEAIQRVTTYAGFRPIALR
jgi:hypothetical protein